jgi:UDP-3-O-[3-hydroxymyristoyl] glucosamine N-acyltransferase
MATTVSAIAEKFSSLIKLERGDKSAHLTGIASGPKAQNRDLVFVSEPAHLALAKAGKSKTWIVHPKLLPLVPEDVDVVLSSPNVMLAMALIGKQFFPLTLNTVPFDEIPIHPTAVIHPTAEIGKGVVIGPHTTIGARAKIGDNCVIGSNTTIEADARIGDASHIHSQVFIGFKTQIGKECVVKPQCSIGTEGFGFAHDQTGNHYHINHYGRVVIEDRVRVGANVQIDRGTFEDSVIGSGTIIDNHCHFGHNFRCGKNCIFVGGVIVAGSVTIGNNCVFGGRTTIGGHIKIVDGCQFAGLSGIAASVEKPGQYGGYPIIPLNESLKAYSSLAQLPKMRRNLARVMKHLGLSNKGE